MQKINKIISIILVALFFLSAGYYLGIKYPPTVLLQSMQPSNVFPKALLRDHSLLTRTAEIIEDNYYKPVTEEDLIKGMVNSLDDPYSVFFPPAQTKEFQEEVSGRYAGIGVVISMDKKRELPIIVSVFPNTPADKAGLKPGDLVVSADGTSLKGLSLDDIAAKVKGKVGTTVKLVVERDGKTFTADVTREEVHIPLIEKKYLDNGNIGYLRINMFSEELSPQVKDALKEMEQKHIKGLVLDLRNNPGGLLAQCTRVASLFVPSGPLLWTKDRKGVERPLNISGTKFPLPLVVLVNNGTASAAEILTGAIKDYGVGKIVGEKTFGKGVIQQIFNLANGYTLKVTVQEYLTAKKHAINKIGIEPDIEVKNDPKKPEQDLQLEKAMEILKGEIGEK
jgi:carboxyl-terminal processing protease